MRVIKKGLSFSQRRLINDLVLILSFIFGSLLLWASLQIFGNYYDFLVRATITFCGYLLMICGYWFYKKKKIRIGHKYKSQGYEDDMIKNFAGNKGENEICTILEHNCNDEYVYIRNHDTGCCGDIDGMLITPKEIINIEVKYCIKNSKFVARYHLKQVTDQEKYLNEKLRANNIGTSVRSIIVLANNNEMDLVDSSHVWITTKDKLINFLINENTRSAGKDIDLLTRQKIIDIFSK